MDLFNVAKQIENDSIRYYTTLAKQTPLRELAGIFAFLANEERCHYELFDSWQKNGCVYPLSDPTMVENLEDMCRKFIIHLKKIDISIIDHYEAYKKALKLEKKSIEFYEYGLELSVAYDQQELLKRIIAEEQIHVKLIESLMEFQRHPGEWLENAEWYHLEEY